MKANHNKGTHRHSKAVGKAGDGYRSTVGKLKHGSSKLHRPDITLSTGKGRHSIANSTIKNHA